MADRPDVVLSAVRPVAEWAGLPCDDARADRLHPFLADQRARMQRLSAIAMPPSLPSSRPRSCASPLTILAASPA